MIVAITEGSVVAIILGLLTFAGVVTTAWFTFLGQKLNRQVNKAVNDRPAGEPTVSEDVTELRQGLNEVRGEVKEIRTTQARMTGQLDILIAHSYRPVKTIGPVESNDDPEDPDSDPDRSRSSRVGSSGGGSDDGE
ncbi:MAG: hypothetical protein AAGA99_00715 [Actinomycetota bacterium]